MCSFFNEIKSLLIANLPALSLSYIKIILLVKDLMRLRVFEVKPAVFNAKV